MFIGDFFSDNVNALRALIELGANVNAELKEDNWTPLHLAVSLGISRTHSH